MNTLIANLSAKKTNPTRSTADEQVDDKFSTEYKGLLQKYGRNETEMADWKKMGEVGQKLWMQTAVEVDADSTLKNTAVVVWVLAGKGTFKPFSTGDS